MIKGEATIHYEQMGPLNQPRHEHRPLKMLGPYAWYALALLTFVYLFNFLDRTLIYILFAPIKREMSFTDFNWFARHDVVRHLLHTAWHSLRASCRSQFGKNMIAAGLAVWSLFSGLTGFATGFWPLFFCRVMVGVGEATLGPAALSLLSDYFPPRMRATVQAIYASGVTSARVSRFSLAAGLVSTSAGASRFIFSVSPVCWSLCSCFFLREERRAAREVSTRQVHE